MQSPHLDLHCLQIQLFSFLALKGLILRQEMELHFQVSGGELMKSFPKLMNYADNIESRLFNQRNCDMQFNGSIYLHFL